MEMTVRFLGDNIAKRFELLPNVVKPTPKYMTTKFCAHFACGRSVEANKPNGFLCFYHQSQLDPAPKMREEALAADAASIGEVDAWKIAVAMSQEDRKEFRLSDMRYCRRIWTKTA